MCPIAYPRPLLIHVLKIRTARTITKNHLLLRSTKLPELQIEASKLLSSKGYRNRERLGLINHTHPRLLLIDTLK